jgi:hypothetical protein
MTDLEDLRRALRVRESPGITAADDLDVALVMRRGRRLRLRRRLVATGGGLCLAGLALAATLGVTHLARPSLNPPQRPVTPGSATSAPVPAPTPPATTTGPPSLPDRTPTPTVPGSVPPTATARPASTAFPVPSQGSSTIATPSATAFPAVSPTAARTSGALPASTLSAPPLSATPG